MASVRTIRHAHLFCGLGGGAAGFNAAGEARVGDLRATFACLGGIDVDAASVADFGRLAGVPGTLLDLFDDDDGPVCCPHCDGEGVLLVCWDDICQGQGYCMHGDGEMDCPHCGGSGECC